MASLVKKNSLEDLSDDVKGRFTKLQKKTFRQQAVWFLNGFWVQEPSFGQNLELCEKMWEYVNKMVELSPLGENGCELDEFKAHVFLEKIGTTLTVKKMRQLMKEIDLDFNKSISLLEFLIFTYKVDIADLVDAPQAADPEAARRIAEARNAVTRAQASVQSCLHAEGEAKKAVAALAKAEAAAQKALDKLNAEQKAFDDKCEELEAKGNDSSLGIVKRNRAKQELAALKQTDPLPLNRAKITQGASVRKLAKAKKKAEKAKAAAVEARKKAEDDFQKAENLLQKEVARASGGGQGELWWMQRELEEAKKYMSPAQLRKLARQEEAKKEE